MICPACRSAGAARARGPPKAERSAGSASGGAKRSRLDLKRVNSARRCKAAAHAACGYSWPHVFRQVSVVDERDRVAAMEAMPPGDRPPVQTRLKHLDANCRHGQVLTHPAQIVRLPTTAQDGVYAWLLLYLAAVLAGCAGRVLVSTVPWHCGGRRRNGISMTSLEDRLGGLSPDWHERWSR